MIKIASAALVSALLGGTYWAYRVAFYATPSEKQDLYELPRGEKRREKHQFLRNCIRQLDELPYEPVQIRSVDGKRLFARYYHSANGAPVQIQFHGYRGCALRDYCGGTAIARKLGHNVLVVDQRCHGRSEGHTITFGVRERYDCQSWANYAYNRFGKDTPLILCGVSMGASTVLMASSLKLPESVCAIIADCPYSSPRAMIAKVAGEMGLPPKPASAICSLGAMIYGRFRLGSCDPLECVKHTKVPVLLIHGEADQMVPCDMSRALYDACHSQKELVTFPGATHGMSYLEDPARYEATVSDFLSRCLKH